MDIPPEFPWVSYMNDLCQQRNRLIWATEDLFPIIKRRYCSISDNNKRIICKSCMNYLLQLDNSRKLSIIEKNSENIKKMQVDIDNLKNSVNDTNKALDRLTGIMDDIRELIATSSEFSITNKD